MIHGTETEISYGEREKTGNVIIFYRHWMFLQYFFACSILVLRKIKAFNQAIKRRNSKLSHITTNRFSNRPVPRLHQTSTIKLFFFIKIANVKRIFNFLPLKKN